MECYRRPVAAANFPTCWKFWKSVVLTLVENDSHPHPNILTGREILRAIHFEST